MVALIDDFGLLVIQTLAPPAAPTVSAVTLDRTAGTVTITPATWPGGTDELLVAFGGLAGNARIAAAATPAVIDVAQFYPDGIPVDLNVRVTAISDNAGEEIQSSHLLLDLSAPEAVGTMGPVSYIEDTGDKTIGSSAFFDGSLITYSLVSPPAGVSINSGSGLITISTTNPLATSTVTVRASNSFGSADQSFSVTVTAATVAPSAVGTISNRTYTQGSGAQTIATAANFAGTTPLTFSLVSPPAGVSINASTGVVTVLTTSVLAASTVTVRATNGAGSADQAFTVTVEAAVVAPAAVGTISNVSYTYGSGNQTVATAANFSGTPPLTYALTAAPAGVTINASTGVVTIPTSTEIATPQPITVRASNSAGNASQTFTVTVSWPASVALVLWPVTEVRDPAEATAQGFPGVDGHLKVSYSPAIVIPSGFVLRSQLLQGASPPAPSGALPAVTPGTLFYTTGPALESTAYPRLYWHHIGSDTFKLAGEQTPFPILGLDEQTGGGLLPFPTAALNNAIGVSNTVYADNSNGMNGGANHPWSAVALAYASLVGQTSADSKLVSQLLAWLSQGGPTVQGGYSAKRDQNLATAIALTKLNTRVWDTLTTGQKNGLTALVEAVGVMGFAIESDNYATPTRGFRGDARPPTNRGGNLNISSAYPGCAAALRVFKGSDAATSSFLDGLDCDDLRTRLNAAGATTTALAFATSRPPGAPSLAQIESAVQNWRSFTRPTMGVSELFRGHLIDELEESCNKTAATGWPPTANAQWVSAGIPNSGTPARGRMINNNNAATIAPVAGQLGMFHDMHANDEGPRSSCGYAIWTGMNPTIWLMVGMAAGLVQKTAAMNAAMARMDVGWRTMKIHSDNGYYSYAHLGGTQSQTWTSANHSTEFGWPYLFPFYFDLIKPMYDAL